MRIGPRQPPVIKLHGMASGPADKWASLSKSLGRAKSLGQAAKNQLPRLRGQRTVSAQSTSPAPPLPAHTEAAQTLTASTPTRSRARRVEYAPNLDGSADPGEVVWCWVQFEEDPSQGKDRPVLVVGREGPHLLGLMLSSQERHDGEPGWHSLGAGPWDSAGRPSWLRLDRVLDVPETGIRREGAVLDKARFTLIAARLQADYGWS